MVEIANTRLLFDPFISPNPNAQHIDLKSIACNYIFLSHGHQDHVADALALAQQNNAQLISNFEVVSWFANKYNYTNNHPMNHGGSWAFEFGTVRYVNAIHSSNMPDGSYGGNPGGFVVCTNEGNLYFAGDTALTMDMQLIPRYANPLQVAILPIGSNFTMDYRDACTCAQWTGCKTAFAVHFDTFPYIAVSHNEVKAHFEQAGIPLILPTKIGQTFEL